MFTVTSFYHCCLHPKFWEISFSFCLYFVSWLGGRLAFYCYCNKLPSTQSLKQHKFVILTFCTSEVDCTELKSRCLQACIPSEGFTKESVSLFVIPSRSSLHSLAHGLFLHPQSKQCSTFQVSVGFLTSYLSLSLTYKKTYNYFGTSRLIHWDHQVNSIQSPSLKILNLTARTKSFLPYKVIYSHVLRIRT